MVHLLATRQLFPFYDILGFRLPAKANLYPLISRKKPSKSALGPWVPVYMVLVPVPHVSPGMMALDKGQR